MAIPAATVKTICTRTEAELVRSSRPPRLGQLTLIEVKQLASRARKLSDKWSGQSRSQSRVQSRKAGRGESAKNTQLKAQAFREALKNFLAQETKLEKEPAARGPKAGRKAAKPRRTAKHRADRAATRKGLSAEKFQLNAPVRKRKAKKAAAKAAAPREEAAPAKPAAKPAAKKRRTAAGDHEATTSVRPAAKKSGKKPAGLSLVGQRQAQQAAKKSRLAASGLISRVRGHVIARGRRKQASRDAKN
jgi:hypothetical protein